MAMTEVDAPWLILDYGSGTMQAGLSTSDVPDRMSVNCIGQAEGNDFTSRTKEAHYKSPASKTTWPIQRGVIKDWPAMIKIWEDVFNPAAESEKLGISDASKDIAGVFLTEPCLNSTKNREKVADYWFSTQNVSRFYIGLQSVCGLNATSRTTGCAVSSGDGVTECVTIFENHALRPSYQRSSWAGRDISDWLRRMLLHAGTSLSTDNDDMLLWHLKENYCKVAQFGKFEEECANLKETAVECKLPDGTTVSLREEIYGTGEAIFNPCIAGKPYPGIQELIKVAISACPVDARKDFYKNIVCFGGNTFFNGFPERLKAEMKNSIDCKTKVVAFPDRAYQPWMGAQIFTILSSFNETFPNSDKHLWVSKAEFNECGINCVARMSPS